MNYLETVREKNNKVDQEVCRFQNTIVDHAIKIVLANKTSSPETNEVLSKIISQLEKLKS